jgi:hypothetical protein
MFFVEKNIFLRSLFFHWKTEAAASMVARYFLI